MAHILVVDDEEPVARSVERILTLSEYRVRVAHNAADALKLARRMKPDLIILDWMMPGMDGLQLCQQFRADFVLSSVPILFLTARGQTDEKIAGLAAGAEDYMTKPFDVHELRLRVGKLIARSTDAQPLEEDNPTPYVLTAYGLALDCLRYTVSTLEKKRIPLTPVEFQLLYHFVSDPGKIFSAEDLLRDVWDFPSDAGTPDLVRVHIRNLRRKIEPDLKQPRYLITIPHHGYTFSTDPD